MRDHVQLLTSEFLAGLFDANGKLLRALFHRQRRLLPSVAYHRPAALQCSRYAPPVVEEPAVPEKHTVHHEQRIACSTDLSGCRHRLALVIRLFVHYLALCSYYQLYQKRSVHNRNKCEHGGKHTQLDPCLHRRYIYADKSVGKHDELTQHSKNYVRDICLRRELPRGNTEDKQSREYTQRYQKRDEKYSPAVQHLQTSARSGAYARKYVHNKKYCEHKQKRNYYIERKPKQKAYTRYSTYHRRVDNCEK